MMQCKIIAEASSQVLNLQQNPYAIYMQVKLDKDERAMKKTT